MIERISKRRLFLKPLSGPPAAGPVLRSRAAGPGRYPVTVTSQPLCHHPFLSIFCCVDITQFFEVHSQPFEATISGCAQ